MPKQTEILPSAKVLKESAFPAIPVSHPLVLDLDLTLIRTDMLHESFITAMRQKPLIIFLCIWLAVTGRRARLKFLLSSYALGNIDFIPINTAVLDLAEREARAGRTIVLATAADELLAARFARRFPVITRWFASNATRNLKGPAKAAILEEAFPQGFIYAGDHAADVPVCRSASGIVAVNCKPSVHRAMEKLGRPMLSFTSNALSTRTILKSLRVHQWVKNALVFVPILLANRMADLSAWGHASVAFAGLCLVASATYLINDLLDMNNDRRHWSKCHRPLASGALSISRGVRLIPALMIVGLALASLAGPLSAGVVCIYAILSVAYSMALKRIPLLDTLIIGVLFTLRLLLGVVAISAVLSPWMFAFSMAVFLSIALAKRHTELIRLRGEHSDTAAGRGYRVSDEPLVLGFGIATAALSCFTLCLYLMDFTGLDPHYKSPAFLWMLPMLVFLWLGRIWILSQRNELNDDPVSFAVRDRTSLAICALVAMCFTLAVTVTLPASIGGRAVSRATEASH